LVDLQDHKFGADAHALLQGGVFENTLGKGCYAFRVLGQCDGGIDSYCSHSKVEILLDGVGAQLAVAGIFDLLEEAGVVELVHVDPVVLEF
jgi:hypothetical protein